MMVNLGVDKQLMARARKKGVDRPPRMLGYYPLRPMGFTRNLQHLENELRKRGVEFLDNWNVTKKCKMLKDHEKQRFENEVVAELQLHELVNSNDNTLSRKLERLKRRAEQTGLSYGGRFEIDTDRFFKKMNDNIPDAMFEGH